MLVMVEAIHEEVRRRGLVLHAEAAWARLADAESPAVFFYLLPLDRHGVRGRPLHQDELAREAAHRVRELQGAFRAGHQHSRREPMSSPKDRRGLGGPDVADPRRRQHRRRRVHPVHRLHHRDLRAAGRDAGSRQARPARQGDIRPGQPANQPTTSSSCSAPSTSSRTGNGSAHPSSARPSSTASPWSCPTPPTTTRRGPFCSGPSGVNLFEQCCHAFDSQRDGRRAFTLQESLLLYAVLLHLIHETEDFNRRARILRNLLAASVADEIRRPNMPGLSRTSRRSSSVATSTRSASSAAIRCRTSRQRWRSSPHIPISRERCSGSRIIHSYAAR